MPKTTREILDSVNNYNESWINIRNTKWYSEEEYSKLEAEHKRICTELEDSLMRSIEKLEAENKKLKEAFEEFEFTNILRKYNCNAPNDCMDEIKGELRRVIGK